METKKHTGAELLLLLLIALLSVPWWAFVAQKVWGWYVMPLGAPAIGFWQLCGLSTAVRFLLGSYASNNATKTDVAKDVLTAWIVPAVVLAFCAFYRWMGV